MQLSDMEVIGRLCFQVNSHHHDQDTHEIRIWLLNQIGYHMVLFVFCFWINYNW